LLTKADFQLFFIIFYYILHTVDYTISAAMEVNTFATLAMSFTSSIRAGTTLINSTVIHWYQLLNKILKNIQC